MEQSNSFVLTENFEMLKALYDFQAVYPKTISFDEGEHFILHQTSAKQRNWWQVVSMKGAIGFVPSNYVMKIKVAPSFLLGFLESSIEYLKMSKEDEINGIISRVELIERLETKKTEIALSAKAIENDNDTTTFNNENHYMGNGSVKSKHSSKYYIDHTPDLPPKTSISTIEMQQPLPTQISLHEISSGPPKLEEATTPTTATAAYDNSITSDPSETTNTTSDDATVISKVGNECNENTADDKSEEINSQSISIEIKSKENVKCEENVTVNELHSDSESNNDKKLTVSSTDVYQILDSIRRTTSLSHELSCVALRVVLSELEAIYSTQVLKFLEPIAEHLTVPLAAPDEFIEHTHDSQRLKVIFSQLAECKNDSEQRTWMLHEDEQYITEFLTELIEILKNADKNVCRFELSCDQYQSIINLVQYYQMETRWPIRKLLLSAFKALCYVESNAIDILLTSVLPMELVQDMKSNIDNLDRLKELAIMLTMIFSVGHKIPINHQEHIGADFILFLMDIIELPPQIDVLEILPDIMINLVLSINLQFDNFTDSFVLDAMRQLTTAKTFTEKILVLLNREEDPLNFFEHSSPPSNSVLKIFVDLFTTPETSSLFYTNDNKVLIDILVRQLSDLSPEDLLRRKYLELCRRIVRNTNYAEHCHRKSDLMKIFTRIFCEESECSLKDQQLVREIANEFPQIFKA